jgi:hypothetical protein
MAAKKRQTMGKIRRERERAEKRALKQEKKEQKKAAAAALREAEAAGMPLAPPPDAGTSADGEPHEPTG